MTAKERRRGGGGKLTRSETVTVRLDPVTRFAAEIAAVRAHQTLSSFLEQGARMLVGTMTVTSDAGKDISLLQLAERCWASDPHVRWRMVWHDAPHLVIPEERRVIEAWAFFMSETNLLLNAAGLEHLVCHRTSDGGYDMAGWHIADGAMSKIAAAAQGEAVDFDAIKRLARQELIDRGFIKN